MIRNFFKVVIRNIIRDRYFTSVNIVGLAIGLAAGVLIFSYVLQELGYDTTHPDVDRMYRVNQTAIWNPEGGIMSSSVLPLARTLIQDYPEIESALRINTPGGQLVRYEQGTDVKAIYENEFLAADSNFFSFFDFKLREGDPATCLRGKNKVVLSSRAAKRFFGDESPMGKTLLIGDPRIPVEVTGVTEEQPRNMHFHFDYMVSIYTNPSIKDFEWSWIWTQVVTYVKIRPDADVAALEKKFDGIATRYVEPTFARFGMNYQDFIKEKDGWHFYLQPVRSIHLYSQNTGNRLGPVSDIRYVYIFSMVGGFVLLLAIINFINLSTARGANRAKEVGVKKVLGAERRTLMLQFQLESVLLTLAATALGLGLMEVLRILINHFIGVQLSLYVWQKELLWFLPLLCIGVGILAGAYPAFYLTTFRPASVLKGRLALGLRKSGLRNVLTAVQFVISIAFIASTIIVYQQLKYFNEKDLGFDRENVLVINHAEKLGTHVEAFRNEAAVLPGVINASVAMDAPGRGSFEDIFTYEGSDAKYPIAMTKMDENFFTTMGMELKVGKTFDKEHGGHGVIINETTATLLGWTPEEAIGKHIKYMGDDVGPEEVVGVVKDFHFQSLRENISPLIFYHINSKMWGDQRIVALKVNSRNTTELLARLKATWKGIVNDAPFEYNFLKEEWIQKYQEEERLAGLFALFSGLSIIIAMIGLVGLVTYSSEQRRKEIGIRKVMGASVTQVVLLLNSNFTRLVIISFVLAVPASWYAMNVWLRQFPYKITIGAGVFAMAGVAMLLITWITVSYQSVRAAMTNPTEVLKDE